MKLNFFRALGTVFLLCSIFPVAAQELMIMDPWVRAAPPNARALGVFMTIKNQSGTDRSVVAARTTLAVERVELHRTVKVGEVMKMVPQESIPVPANGSTRLKPGSWHVMLIGPDKVPAIDDKLQLTLVFADGSEQTVEAVVRKGKKMMHDHNGEKKHIKKHLQRHSHDHEHEPEYEPKPGEKHMHKHQHEHAHEHKHEMKQE